MKAKVVKTENGWEPAFLDSATGVWGVEPGFAEATRKKALDSLRRALVLDEACDADCRVYQAGYDAACGY